MEQYEKDFLNELREKRTTYADMINFCCDNCLLNNEIVPELEKSGFYFDNFCGSIERFFNENGDEITEDEYSELEGAYSEIKEIYQYYIISERDAERLADYTNEIIIFNEDLDLYLLCVTHFGTAWSGVSSNWKNPEKD